MREILFRGKQSDTGEWVEGFLLKVTIDGKSAYLIFGDNFCFDGSDVKALSHALVDPATVGQFTGLVDKHGKRIFEGDIITFGNGLTWVVGFELNAFVAMDEDNQVQFALFEQYKWKPNKANPCAPEPIAPNHVEIIGNIHDNQELLEGGDTDGKERTE